jgi:pyruvate dehydrogenase E2 component (dihydrolipoamide acetyltransferase)
MASPIQLLQLSPTMTEGTIVRWLVKEGDKVSAGTTLAEVETDKAVMELESFEDGKILKLTAKEGDSVPVGSTIGYIGQAGEAIPGDGAAPAPKKADAKPAAKVEEKAPAVAAAGAKADKTEKVAAVAAASGSNGSSGKSAVGDRVFASPLARKMAAEHGISLDQLHGSGPGNRVIKRDIEAALESGVATEVAKAPAAQKPPAVAVPAGAGDEEISLSGMRKVIARRLVQSRQEVPSFSLTVEVAAEPLERAVARLRELFPEEKVTLTHFLIKAMAAAIMKHDWLRTQWVDGKLIRKNAAHISVAVAVGEGLLTPVIRNAESKGVVALSRELRDLAAKARDRKLTETDLSGGVQTLSNLGMFGISQFDAIINPPEASILAVGAVVEKPVVRGGQLVVGRTYNITLSCDHRVVDGAVGAAFLKDLKGLLEEPLAILA